MTVMLNVREHLKEFLQQHDAQTVGEVIDDLRYDLMPKSGFLDAEGQGEKCEPGQESCIGEEEFTESLEAVWGVPNFLSAHFLTEGAKIQRAVAMVTLKVPKSGLPAGNGWGSGFLVSDSLFMTNNHVIPNKSFCDDVNMQFMYQDAYGSEPAFSPEFFETDEDSFFYTNAGLDFTIVRLKRKPYRRYYRLADDARIGDLPYVSNTEQTDGLEYLKEFTERGRSISDIDSSMILRLFGYYPGFKYGFVPMNPSVYYPVGQKLNIIQHPKGRKKEVVVQENTLKDVHTNVIHYISDTDYGSSGSPVFNNTWDLMALHHARKNSEQANEGIRIDKIVADLRSQFGTSNPALLTELGI